jgi:hypothetical protein
VELLSARKHRCASPQCYNSSAIYLHLLPPVLYIELNRNVMMKEFRKLEPHEYEFMLKAPLLVCILIAGADGKIDRNEMQEAISIASWNKNTKGVLSEYFQEVSKDFEDKLKVLIQNYPYESTQRSPIIIDELSSINTIWPKLNNDFALSFYNMLLDLSARVASSSGGWLGIRSVGSQEAMYVKLPMISDPSKI